MPQTAIKSGINPQWVATEQQYEYSMGEIYQLSLFLILTSHLMDAAVTPARIGTTVGVPALESAFPPGAAER